MEVFKATHRDMTCTMGKGDFKYKLGVPSTAEQSKCGNTGLHACEYVVDCITYYPMGKGNRYFRAEAEGDIAEDGTNTRISCTKLTLVERLSNRDIAREAMKYMIRHPKRDGWTHRSTMIEVAADKAVATCRDGIAIARGVNPQVKGCKGANLGILLETAEGIGDAKLFVVDGKTILSGVWYDMEKLRELERSAEK